MTFRNRHHYIIALITIICALASAYGVFCVNVNSDMTKYLPDDSQMKQGVRVLSTEFDASQLSAANVRVMMDGLTDDRRQQMADSLALYPDVNWVNARVSDDGRYTLYEIQTPDDIDQKALGRTIRKDFGKQTVVETAQDGATPPMSVIIIAAAMIVIILLITAKSWLDPVVFLLNAGIAIVLNIGTNALLPSVSITTNYIGSILQLVLSLDFSIVLLNRYRQECSPEKAPVESMNAAIRRALRPIMSSAFTTIVGLLVLVMMRLKIGMDMGIVLAKGVVCSLVCTFTLLPSIIMLFDKGIAKSGKKTFVLPTDRLSRFVFRFRIPLTLFGVALVFVSWWFSRKTDIYFCTNGESQIEKVFPKVNPFVLIYPTDEEMRVIPLADSLAQDTNVEMILSYPTLLKKRFTADQMCGYITSMGEQFAEYAPNMDFGDMNTPEMMRIVYYMSSDMGDTLRIPFPDLMRFIAIECSTNPLFASYINDDMRSQMALLQTLIDQSDAISSAEKEAATVPTPAPKRTFTASKKTVTAKTPAAAPAATTSAATAAPASQPASAAPASQSAAAPQSTAAAPAASNGLINLIEFCDRLYAADPSESTAYLTTLCDVQKINTPMTVDQMSDFIGSSRSQTKTVYSFTKGGKNSRLTPLQYVHFLIDDLFQRKALQAFVSTSQKNGLKAVAAFMDAANSNAELTADQIAAMLTRYGYSATRDRVIALNTPKQTAPQVTVAQATSQQDAISSMLDSASIHFAVSLAVPDSFVAAEKQAAENARKAAAVKARPKRHYKTKAEKQADLFVKYMEKAPRLRADSCAIVLSQLGQDLDPKLIRLLYQYYGSSHCYPDSLLMSTEELLHYVADSIVTDSTMSVFIDEKTAETISSAKGQLGQAVSMISGERYAVMIVMTSYPAESEATYDFAHHFQGLADRTFPRVIVSGPELNLWQQIVEWFGFKKHEPANQPYYLVGESVMYTEMRDGFSHEMTVVTILTVLSILLIVALSFRSLVLPIILVTTVMTAVFVNVIFAGLLSGKMLYLAYLIVQSILMGATIDYGILYANYYREYRRTMPRKEACTAAYRGAIPTIMTSGLIMFAAPGIMAIFVEDVAIRSIVGCLSIGAACAIIMILCVLPAVLVFMDRFVVNRKRSVKEDVDAAPEVANPAPEADAPTPEAADPAPESEEK